MSQPVFRVGTRGSALATTQTTTAAEALSTLSHQQGRGLDYELVLIKTEGDVNMAPLKEIGGTGVFVASLRQALLDGRCDVAVHSLKDLPAAPHPGLSIAAYSAREDVRDALCAHSGHTLGTLPAGAVVGTGSPRRAAQLALLRPDLQVVGIRGNVGTRLGRVKAEGRPVIAGKQGDLDAVVLAASGLKRLGFEEHITHYFSVEEMIPAPGQGALAIEARSTDVAPGGACAAAGQHTPDDGAVQHDESLPGFAAMLAGYDNLTTRLAVTAERAVLAELAAGCSAPIGGYAHYEPNTAELQLAVLVADEAGSRAERIREQATVHSEAEAAELGRVVARKMREVAADLITRSNHFGG